MVAEPRTTKFLRAQSHPIPRIFFVLADHLDIAGEAEELHGFKTAPVHLLSNREHRAGFHAERPKAQLPVAHGGVDKANFVHGTSQISRALSIDLDETSNRRASLHVEAAKMKKQPKRNQILIGAAALISPRVITNFRFASSGRQESPRQFDAQLRRVKTQKNAGTSATNERSL